MGGGEGEERKREKKRLCFCKDTETTEINRLTLHDARPIYLKFLVYSRNILFFMGIKYVDIWIYVSICTE